MDHKFLIVGSLVFAKIKCENSFSKSKSDNKYIRISTVDCVNISDIYTYEEIIERWPNVAHVNQISIVPSVTSNEHFNSKSN